MGSEILALRFSYINQHSTRCGVRNTGFKFYAAILINIAPDVGFKIQDKIPLSKIQYKNWTGIIINIALWEGMPF